MYSGERIGLDVSGPFNSLASGPLAVAVFNERRRFRVFGGTAKSTARERLGSLGEGVIELGVSGSEDRSIMAGAALDVAVDVAKSAI